MEFIFFIPFIIGFFGLVIFTIFLVWIIRKFMKPKSAEFVADEQATMRQRVENKKSELTPWKGHSYMDITMAMTFKKGFSAKLQGEIYSPQREPIVAFDRVERGLITTGYMFASSTDFDFVFHIKGEEYTVQFNGELLGKITRVGDIWNAQGNVIGNAKHPVKATIGGDSEEGIEAYRFGASQFPLHMNGRQLATINVSPKYSESLPLDYIFDERDWGQPVLNLHGTPSREEEKWLLALAIFETAFHGNWLM